MLSAQLSINNLMPVEFKGKGVVGCKDQRRGISGPLKKKKSSVSTRHHHRTGNRT